MKAIYLEARLNEVAHFFAAAYEPAEGKTLQLDKYYFDSVKGVFVFKMYEGDATKDSAAS